MFCLEDPLDCPNFLNNTGKHGFHDPFLRYASILISGPVLVSVTSLSGNALSGAATPRPPTGPGADVPPIIFGDGQQTRDFTEVSDIVRGIILAGECDDLIGETVNIAAGTEVSINEVANNILKILDHDDNVTPIYMEARPGDVRRHFADISKAHQFLNFKAQIGIEEGVRQYINWVKQQSWDLKQLQREEVIINWG